jgi:predicted permease
MISDLKYVLRLLAKSPGFAFTAIITLALGIGANAVVFSVLNAIILRPINVPRPQNVYMVQRFQYPSQSYLDYVDLRDHNRTFESLISYDIMGPVGVDTGANPSTAWPYSASGNYFDALGIQPYLGRFFHASDEKGPNSAPYIVLSYAYWHGYFHGDPNVIGHVVQINKHPLTIIGVAPKEFRGTELFFAPAFWFPIIDEPLIRGFDSLKYRGDHSEMIIGRLKPGVTPQQATQDLNSVGAWLAKTYPADDDGVKFTLARPGLVGDFFGGPARAFMAGLMLLSALILLAACANLGSLFAARAADRSKEVALRLALGSSRGHILRQLLSEAILVSLAGGIMGLGAGVLLLRLLSAWQPVPDIPINVPVSPDALTYMVAILMSVASGLLFGMVPMRQVMRADPWQMIRSGMSSTTGLKRFTVRDVLLAVQIAICAVLVTSSFVAVRGMVRSLHSNFGFNPANTLLVSSDVHMSGYNEDQMPQMEHRMMDAVTTIPGVTSVGTINNLPLGMGGGDSYVYPDSATEFRPTNYILSAMHYAVFPNYFATAGTRILAGRDISLHDGKTAPKVVVINRSFAIKAFGSIDKAIGGHIKYWGGERAEVVGVVEDGKYRFLTEEPQGAMFFSLEQHTSSDSWLLIHTNRSPQEISEAVERRIHGIDSTLPITLRTWDEELSGALFAPRVATVALGVLGMLGAMLAVTGIFGMSSYVVSKRLRELGIRVALGASRQEILWASLGRAFRLLGIGSIAGLGLGLLATKVLSFIVYQATPKDPLVLGSVILTMLLLGLVAAWIPARRALAADPLVLLREE